MTEGLTSSLILVISFEIAFNRDSSNLLCQYNSILSAKEISPVHRATTCQMNSIKNHNRNIMIYTEGRRNMKRFSFGLLWLHKTTDKQLWHRYDVKHNNNSSTELYEHPASNGFNLEKALKVNILRIYSVSTLFSLIKMHEEEYVCDLLTPRLKGMYKMTGEYHEIATK